MGKLSVSRICREAQTLKDQGAAVLASPRKYITEENEKYR
jgi:hypothetical protein